MADKAFALSPISARAAQPDEADYEAIREAFMETARGRWFLGEYAKRNRNADTRMVLDEVARIEQTLEALQQSTEALQQSKPDPRLFSILASIRIIIDQATEVAAADDLAIEQRLAPIRKGARILNEISWLWREIGAESRICDAIESQVNAILESCRDLERVDPRAGLTAAFELMRARIEALARENELPIPPGKAPAASVHSAGSEPPRVAATVSTEAGGYAKPPAQPELELPAASHPSLGPTPFSTQGQEPDAASGTDPSAAIRRMTLIEKIAFFA
jgi:hypothetical protein